MKALVFYIETGNGFKSPAIAIARELQGRGVEVEALDFYKAVRAPALDRFVVEGWRFFLRHPRLFKGAFALADTPFIDFVYAWVFPLVARGFEALLREERPDFVVSTHYMSTHLAARLLARRGGRAIPCFGYNSDVILSHRAYIDPDASMYYVPTAMGRDAMLAQGMPADRLSISGFPIDPKFRKAFASMAEERARLGLKDMFTLLVTFGGEGIGDAGLVEAILERGLPVQVVAVCGKNEALLRELEELAAARPALAFRALGFVSNLQDYLYCCDVSAGKAGLNVAFESIFMGRPFMALSAMANERFCAEFIRDSGYGWYPASVEEALAIVERAAGGGGELERIRERLGARPCEFGIEGMVRSMIEITETAKAAALKGAKALLFDLAGTLCDIPIQDQWERINGDGIAAVLGELGFPGRFGQAAQDELVARFIDEKKRLRKDAKVSLREYEVKEQLKSFFDSLAAGSGAVAAWFAALRPDAEAWRKLEGLFVGPELAITVPFAEAPAVLDRLARKFPLYLLSNNVSRALVEGILEKCGLSGRFREVFVSSDIGFRKPHGKFIDEVLAKTGLRANECVMIGDRVSQDIKMAQDFGMLSVYAAMVEHEDNLGVEGVRWDAKIGALEELVELFGCA